MDPTVVAAWIAAGVSVLTLVGTLAAQYLGRRATARDAEKAFAEQRRQLERTLDAQNRQLERTLGEQRTRTFNERFATAAEQIGSDKPPEVRLAGVYAMAGLADDWAENRQTCVDVLCAYLRMPYEPDPGQDNRAAQLAFQASREIRHTVIRVVTAHLKEGAETSWQGLDFDFTGVVFDGGDFSGACFSGGTVTFAQAQFPSGAVSFHAAKFSGSTVSFEGAEFISGTVSFFLTEFSGGEVDFRYARFAGGSIDFRSSQFSGALVSFFEAVFSGGEVDFRGATFSGGKLYFGDAVFSGGKVDFTGAGFTGALVVFFHADFSGSAVDFTATRFSGGSVDFWGARDWSYPPAFPWIDTPPLVVKLPDASSA
jgi:uncharacterized protein YjbI with pentapeptide repeats